MDYKIRTSSKMEMSQERKCLMENVQTVCIIHLRPISQKYIVCMNVNNLFYIFTVQLSGTVLKNRIKSRIILKK